MKNRKTVTGRLILFQEERIRLVDERGASYLFDLDHNLPVSQRELSAWINEHTRLDLSYSGEPETESGVVHSIRKAA